MFEINYAVRGHHIYQRIWAPVIGEELICKRDLTNHHNRFAVAVIKDIDTVVGHAPRKVSSVFTLFLRHGGTIKCRVTGHRCYSKDLPQGGSDVPCVYVFDGKEKDLLKAEELIKQALISIPDSPIAEPLSKRRRIGMKPDVHSESPSEKAVDCDLITSVLRGEKLSDKHMYLAQGILKNQFPDLKGSQSTLLQGRRQVVSIDATDCRNCLQVINSRENHWILASSVGCGNKVNIYDSVFSQLDEETKQVVCKLFQIDPINIEMKTFQKQVGGTECGLFSIAALTAIAFSQDPSKITFSQEKMRDHLATCLRNEHFTLFPNL